MKRTSELDEIEAALKRAAYKAIHGTREERSGRFLPDRRLDPKGTVLIDRVRDSKAGAVDKWCKR